MVANDKRGKKYSFADEVETVLKPESVEAKREFEETAESIKECGTPDDVEPVKTPAIEVKDPEPDLQPEELRETIIAQPLKTVGDIKAEYAKMSAKQYGDTFVQPEGSVIPDKFDLDEELRKLLVVNTDYDMVRTLVRFDGADTNYYLLEVHPERVYKAWKLYAEHEGKVPGKFMEKVFAILTVNNQRYFHKVSTVELR